MAVNWLTESDNILDLALGVDTPILNAEDIRPSTSESASEKYIPPHKLRAQNQQSVQISQTPTPKPSIVAKNNKFAIVCGCHGKFFWELIPVVNLNYFRGTVPDTVDHCICSVKMYNTFTEAFWEGYNHCITKPTDVLAFQDRDYCLGVYQTHPLDGCPRQYTRYTLGSVKKFLMFNESLRIYPIIGVYCQCETTKAFERDSIAFNICYNCLQCTLELKAISPLGVLKHFTHEVSYNVDFMKALNRGPRNSCVYFLAQSLFNLHFSQLRYLGEKLDTFIYNWTINGRHCHEIAKHTSVSSFCLICHQAGNGFLPFLCTTCAEDKLKAV